MSITIILFVLFFVFLGMGLFMQLYQNKLLNSVENVPIITKSIEVSENESEELI